MWNTSASFEQNIKNIYLYSLFYWFTRRKQHTNISRSFQFHSIKKISLEKGTEDENSALVDVYLCIIY